MSTEFEDFTPEEMKKYRQSLGQNPDGLSQLGEQAGGDTSGDMVSQNYAQNAQAENAKLAALTSDGSKVGGKISAAGDATTAGGAMGGNPTVMGAGLALKTVGMADDAHRQSEQAKITAYNNKIMAQRSAIRNMFA